MQKYLFTNIHGSYIFDKDFNLIKLKESKDPYKSFLALSNKEFTQEEKELLHEHKSEGLIVLNKKKDDDENKSPPLKILLQGVLKTLSLNPSELKDFNDETTIKQIKNEDSADHLLIQSISSIEEIDKSINLLTRRLREFCEVYIPELSRNIGDNERYSELIIEKSRDELLKEYHILEEKAMGNNVPDEDLAMIRSLGNQINLLFAQRLETQKYIESKMKIMCPNLLYIAGDTIGAKLIARAGSLKKLAMLPASTIQLLGAEKALFRHLKTGARCPKHGLISQHQFIQSRRRDAQGKAARLLSEKISLCARVDYFKGQFVADKMLADITERINANGK